MSFALSKFHIQLKPQSLDSFFKEISIAYSHAKKILSEYLHIYHKEKVMVLIDEYDTPIQSSYKKLNKTAYAVVFRHNLSKIPILYPSLLIQSLKYKLLNSPETH